MRFLVTAKLCDWGVRAERVIDLARRCREGQEINPFVMLHALDEPEIHFLAAKATARLSAPTGTFRPAVEHGRLRVAYLSGDFREHPMAYQIVELFERHDRARFETCGFCLQPGPESPIRQRVRRSFDHFVEAAERSDREIAALLEKFQIDIAVDLGGYTDGSRTRALLFRPAPIAVSYLGYPGTLGADYIDYIIADPHVIPPESEHFYTEKIARMPDCYYPSDTKDRGEAMPPSRAAAGLPEKGFVFCTFNNICKLTPEIFDIWMRLLSEVEGSVLWLFASHPATRTNLRAEAKARQVAPERLIFADYQEHSRHLARIALADLFLDTLPYNAHTTANDALWAGVPVLTCMGRSFAARVAGSQLTAIGADELITHDLGAYEALALKLALHPDGLAAIRARIAKARDGSALFDMERLCRNLENAYETMWDLHLKGHKPESFSVETAR
jgi:predicted O-linked N-acetylglucosamine transferase (SPINDLY family)